MLSRFKRAIVRVLGVLGAAACGLLVAAHQTGIALAEYTAQRGGDPYYYSGYPGPPTWFWIIVFSCVVSAVVVFVADGSVKNAGRR
jgi:hypothetical protein